jgi:hypothetical protein
MEDFPGDGALGNQQGCGKEAAMGWLGQAQSFHPLTSSP